MPQSIVQSQLLTYLAAGVFILLALAVFTYVIRQLFGRKIRSPGPRNRPRRLDVVDVFDLDRERQLVIVRRDNIEHLLLIGGPNDVLVESAIYRGEPLGARAESREARPPALAPGWPPAPIAPEVAAPPAPAERPPREAPLPPARAPASPPREPAIPAAAVADALRRRPAPETARPLPAPIAPEPEHPAELSAPEPPRPQTQPVEAPPPQPQRPASAPPLRPLSPRPPTPPFLARTQRVAPPPKREPPPAAQRPASPPAEPPPAPPPAPAPPEEKDALESLEAEMARLLGRPEN